MLFLVKGKFRISYYNINGNNSTTKDVSNLVESSDKYDISDKFVKYYENKSEEYHVSYSVMDSDVMETII